MDQAQPISAIAQKLGLDERFVEPYGRTKAKIDLDILPTLANKPRGKYILVSAVTPTPLGEGKTTTSIGLGMGLAHIGKRAVVALRQSSLGPAFGIKGGGAGGGKAKLIPLEESILHLTGDIHAIGQAHNQIAAMTDNVLFHDNPLDLDPLRIQIRRVLDVNDRVLRKITVGQGGPKDGVPRETGFDITVASELMAILALCDGHDARSALKNLRERIGRMVVAFDKAGAPVTAEKLRAAGAATVIMKETLKPTLMQTRENTPVLLHAGPFGNIAHGNSSILADRIGLGLAEYVVTEAGFASDMGAEKFFNIKCRTSGLAPDAAVLVTTVRALKSHSGRYVITAGKPLPKELLEENPDDVRAGAANLVAHIQILQRFGVPVVVAVNAFPEDKPSELAVIRETALGAGARGMAVSRAFAEGGAGAAELAQAVVEAAQAKSEFKLLYPNEASIKDKIHTLATEIYGASEVSYTTQANEQLASFEAHGFGGLPICMSKTHLSISHDSKLRGAPKGYTFPVREVRVSAGAGFIYPLAGDIVTMPGLGSTPAAASIDIDENGETVGLY